jgi:hypothetical protein
MKNTIIGILILTTFILGLLQINGCNEKNKVKYVLINCEKNYINESKDLETNLTKNDSLDLFQKFRYEIYKQNWSIPIDSNDAINLTDTFINYCVKHLNKDAGKIEKSVYFHSQDIESLLSIPCNSESSQKGIRAYFAKYPDNMLSSDNKPHPYAGRFTVVLRAACDTNDIAYDTFINPAYDFGDVCPPNCSPEKYSDATGTIIRNQIQFKNGFSKTKTIEGGKFRGDGLIRRKYK